MKNKILITLGVILALLLIFGIKFYSEETQNNFKRAIMSSYGFKNGRVDVLAGHQEPVMSWFKVEKLTTATASNSNQAREYRFGFGIYDENHNGKLDKTEELKGTRYFEISPFTMYVYRDDS